MLEPSTLIQNLFLAMIKNVVSMWKVWVPFLLIIILSLLVKQFIINQERKNKYNKLKSLEDLRNLSGRAFEEYISVLFNKLGFTTTLTGGSHDGGIDLIFEKDGKKHYVQCKKRTNIKVSVGEVRDFYGAISDKMNAKGYFVTTQTFTTEAELFAKDKPIELIDQFALLKYIKLADMDKDRILKHACPSCGGNMVERTGKFGKFLGCSNYPNCRYTEVIR